MSPAKVHIREMNDWITPDFVEIKMDAEIGSYQEDPDPIRGDDVEIDDDAS